MRALLVNTPSPLLGCCSKGIFDAASLQLYTYASINTRCIPQKDMIKLLFDFSAGVFLNFGSLVIKQLVKKCCSPDAVVDSLSFVLCRGDANSTFARIIRDWQFIFQCSSIKFTHGISVEF